MSVESVHAAIYRDVVREHARAPRCVGHLQPPCRHARMYNPLCGDATDVYLRIDADGCVGEIRHQTDGCQICVAAASLMCEAVRDQTIDAATRQAEQFAAIVAGDVAHDSDMDRSEVDLHAFAGVANYPTRHGCALLPWQALQAALTSEADPATMSTHVVLETFHVSGASDEADGR